MRYLIGAALFCVMLVLTVYFGRGDEARALYWFIASVVVLALFFGLDLKRKRD